MMFRYKVVVGTADPRPDGSPSYDFRLNDDPRRKSLESVLNQLAKEGWEPWHMALPISYTVFRDKPNETPVTLIFRRREDLEQ